MSPSQRASLILESIRRAMEAWAAGQATQNNADTTSNEAKTTNAVAPATLLFNGSASGCTSTQTSQLGQLGNVRRA